MCVHYSAELYDEILLRLRRDGSCQLHPSTAGACGRKSGMPRKNQSPFALKYTVTRKSWHENDLPSVRRQNPGSLWINLWIHHACNSPQLQITSSAAFGAQACSTKSVATANNDIHKTVPACAGVGKKRKGLAQLCSRDA